MPQAHKYKCLLDSTGQFITEKLSAKNLSPSIAAQISNLDEGRRIQAPNPSKQQKSEEKLLGFLRYLSQKSEENTKNYKTEDFGKGERQSSMRKGKRKRKDSVSIPFEENNGGKIT